MTIISLDGIPTKLVNPDLDGDGITGGIERVVKKFTSDGVTNIQQNTELEAEQYHDRQGPSNG